MVSKYAGYPDMTMKEKYSLYGIKTIGYLDIETSGLTADFDIMLSWANLIRDVETGKTSIEYDFVEKKDFNLAFNKRNADLVDKRITETVVDSLKQCDLLIGHWFIGKHRHDIPFIRSRCVINHVKGFPKHKQIRYGDTQKWGSLLYRLHNNGLDSIARQFSASVEKTRLDGKTWKNACMGLPNDIKYVLDHNKKDVELTYEIHKGMEEYVPIPATYA
jgi:hypothetical protein